MGKIPPFLTAFKSAAPSLEQAATVLQAAAVGVPGFRVPAAAASILRHLEGPEELRLNSILQLLGSESVTTLLRGLGAQEKRALRAAVTPSQGARPQDLWEALDFLAEGIVAPDPPPTLVATLESLIEAGGLPVLVLGLETHYAGFSAEDAGGMMRRYSNLAGSFLREFASQIPARRRRGRQPAAKPARRFRYVTRRASNLVEQGSAAVREGVSIAVRLGGYLEQETHPLSKDLDQQPMLLGDLLLDRPGLFPGRGSCGPLHALASGLARMVGRTYDEVPTGGHSVVYDRAAGLVFDFSPPIGIGVSTLEDWGEVGALGPSQTPLSGLTHLSAPLSVLGSLSARSGMAEEEGVLFQAALRLFPDHPWRLMNRAATLDREAALTLRQRALEINPEDPHIHMMLGLGSAGAEGAEAHFTAAFQKSEAHQRRAATIGLPAVVALRQEDHLSMKTSLAVKLMLGDRYSTRAAEVLLAVLQLDPTSESGWKLLTEHLHWMMQWEHQASLPVPDGMERWRFKAERNRWLADWLKELLGLPHLKPAREIGLRLYRAIVLERLVGATERAELDGATGAVVAELERMAKINLPQVLNLARSGLRQTDQVIDSLPSIFEAEVLRDPAGTGPGSSGT